MDMELAETNVMFIEGEVRQAILKEIMTEGEVMQAALEQVDISGQQATAIGIVDLWQRFEHASLGKHEFNERTFQLANQAGSYDTLLYDLEQNETLRGSYDTIFEEMKKLLLVLCGAILSFNVYAYGNTS